MFRVLIVTLAAEILSSCIAVPVPWFPRNPYPPEQIRFLEDSVHRTEVVSRLGAPWANLDTRTFVYIADQDSGYILWGVYGGSGGAVPINRDYFLVIDFDEHGLVRHYETWADSLRHQHCFDNGVCLERRTFNIPLAPPREDAEAKRFEPEPGRCVVYVFRDPDGTGLSENTYADIRFQDTWSRFRRIATSVEHGFSRLVFTPSKFIQLEVSVKAQSLADRQHGPFDNEPPGEKKIPVSKHFSCADGQLRFLRIYVPEKNRASIAFHEVDPDVAQKKMSEMRLLLERRHFLEEELKSGTLQQ